MSKYAALFSLALCVSAGWTLGRHLAHATCQLAHRKLSQWRTRKGKGKRLFR